MSIEDIILKEWENAGGEYALAARLVRIDIEIEKQKRNEE